MYALLADQIREVVQAARDPVFAGGLAANTSARQADLNEYSIGSGLTGRSLSRFSGYMKRSPRRSQPARMVGDYR